MGPTLLADVARDDTSVVTVGTFDGVHAGHQALLAYVLDRALIQKGRSVAVTFDPHPRAVLHGDEVPLLSTVDERAEVMFGLGIESVVVIPFTAEFGQLSAGDFVNKILVDTIGLREIVVGYDFTFGRDRQGNSNFLKEEGIRLGFSVDVVPAELMDTQVVSSRRIRQLLADEGDVSTARELLKRPYAIAGSVQQGDRRGRTIGYPTANIGPLDSRKLIPHDGVYAVHVKTERDRTDWGGMMNIGRRPTFGGERRTLEVHLFDFEDDLYGETLTIEFAERIRSEQRFDSVEQLKEQLSLDERRCRRVLGAVS